MKRIRLTEQRLRKLVEQALNEINSESKEAVAGFRKRNNFRGIKLNGFNDEIAQTLAKGLTWDTGVEGGACHEFYYPINGDMEAFAEVGAFVEFDKKGSATVERFYEGF